MENIAVYGNIALSVLESLIFVLDIHLYLYAMF